MESLKVKNCSNLECKQNNPQSLECFSFKKASKDGHKSRCKSCISEQERNRPKTPEDKERSRKRTAEHRKIHKERLDTEREKKKKDPIFKLKAAQASAKYRSLHSDRIFNQNEKAKQDPILREKRKISYKKHRNKDPENYRKRENERNATLENRLKRRESSNKSSKKNPAIGAARAMKRHGAKLSRTPKWLTEKQQKQNSIFYVECVNLQTFFDITDPLQVDHIIPLQGENVSGLHVPWNLQILPRSLNIKKGNKILEESSDIYKKCEEFKNRIKEIKSRSST